MNNSEDKQFTPVRGVGQERIEPVGDGSWVLPGKGQNQSVNHHFGGPTMCQAVNQKPQRQGR